MYRNQFEIHENLVWSNPRTRKRINSMMHYFILHRNWDRFSFVFEKIMCKAAFWSGVNFPRSGMIRASFYYPAPRAAMNRRITSSTKWTRCWNGRRRRATSTFSEPTSWPTESLPFAAGPHPKRLSPIHFLAFFSVSIIIIYRLASVSDDYVEKNLTSSQAMAKQVRKSYRARWLAWNDVVGRWRPMSARRMGST